MPAEDLENEIRRLLDLQGPVTGDEGLGAILDAIVARLGELSAPSLDVLCRLAGIERDAVDRLVGSRSALRAAAEGRVRVMVCEGSSCFRRRSGRVLRRAEQALGLKIGQTAPDGSVCLVRALCLGHCEHGPNVQVGRTGHNALTPEKVAELLGPLRPDAKE